MNVQIKLLYGETGLVVEVPDTAVIVEPKHLTPVADD